MFSDVPVRIWLVIMIAAIAYTPARYVYRYLRHSPARHDITQPNQDLRWRTKRKFGRNIAILVGLGAFTIFIFTPAAEQFAREPNFWPVLMLAFSGWVLSTVPRGLRNGHVQPIARGFSESYERKTQPKRFWASLGWNAIMGGFLLWATFMVYQAGPTNGIRNRCYDAENTRSPQDVITACNRLIDRGGHSNEELSNFIVSRGNAHYRHKYYKKALADYMTAGRLDPSASSVRYNLGLVYEELGDNEYAIAEYSAAISLNTDNADAYRNRGMILMTNGRLTEAVVDFTRAIEIHPHDIDALAQRGFIYAARPDADRAHKDFDAIKEIDPSSVIPLHGEALLSLRAGDMKSAIHPLTAALNRYPDDIWALRARAQAYTEIGEHDKAQEDRNRLKQLQMAPNKRHQSTTDQQ